MISIKSVKKIDREETNKKILAMLHSLNKKKVVLLEDRGWSTENVDYDSSLRYDNIFDELFNKVIKNRICKHFNTDCVYLQYFSKGRNGEWYGRIVDPDITFSVNRVLKGDYSELKALRSSSESQSISA